VRRYLAMTLLPCPHPNGEGVPRNYICFFDLLPIEKIFSELGVYLTFCGRQAAVYIKQIDSFQSTTSPTVKYHPLYMTGVREEAEIILKVDNYYLLAVFFVGSLSSVLINQDRPIIFIKVKDCGMEVIV